MRLFTLVFGTLLLGSPAFAQTAFTPEVPAAEQPQSKTEKLICRRDVVVGSLIAAKKTCRTKSEWDRIAEAGRTGAQDLIDRNTGRPGSN